MNMKTVIFTDFEPDDALALITLQKRGLLEQSVIIVTESLPEITIKKAQYIKQLFNVDVYTGASSTATFNFNIDVTQSIIPQIHPQQLMEFLSHTSLIICLSPPRDLFNLYLTNNDFFQTTNFDNCQFYIYGSFNFNCVLTQTNTTDFEKFINTTFPQTYVFETYPALPNSSINSDTMPKTTTYILSVPWLIDFINYWNTYKYEKLKKQLTNMFTTNKKEHLLESLTNKQVITDPDLLSNKSVKIWNNIVSHKIQMTCADVLVAAYINNIGNNNNFKKKYISFRKNENRNNENNENRDSNVMYFLPSNPETIISDLDSLFANYLTI